LSVAFFITVSCFGSWAVFDLVMGPFCFDVGRFGHTENLWAVLVWAVLVHGPFWSFPFLNIVLICYFSVQK